MKRISRATRLGLVLAIGAMGLSQLSAPPASAAAIASVNQVDGGYDHVCALSGTDIYCWGRNVYGQLGNGTSTNSSIPVLVSGGQTWASVSAGDYYTCALTTGGAAYCWGADAYETLGNGASGDSTTPTPVLGGHTWLSISAGSRAVCGVETGGDAYCWGSNYLGALGDNSGTDKNQPSLVAGSHSWTSVSVGVRHACGIATGGTAYCWGSGLYGSLGDGSFSHDSPIPVAVVGGHTWTAIDAGNEIACGIDTGGAAYCWGYNQYGAIGDGSTSARHTPTAVSGGGVYQSINAEWETTCAVTTTHVAECWGVDALGATGTGGGGNVSVPVTVSGGYLAETVTMTGGGGCLKTTLGLAYCWGYGIYGTLGDGGSANVNTPVGVLTFANLQNGTVISAVVDPSFTFTVSGLSSACNGESGFVNVGTSWSVPLAHLAAGSSVSGGQTLSVASNAGGGFAVYVRGTQSSQNLRLSGHNWTDVTGTYGSYAALGSGERFGYTFKDSTTSSSVTNPGSALYAALDSTNRAVAGSTSTTSGSACISYTAQASSTTPAASYSATVIYVAVPSF